MKLKVIVGSILILMLPIVYLFDMNKDEFAKIFQAEINNRAFAYRTISKLTEQMKDTEQIVYWEAHFRLEQFNQPQYEAIAKKYGFKVNDTKVKLKSWSTNIAFRLFPETFSRDFF